MYMLVLRVLNHAGVCLSYDATWQYLHQLSCEARYLDVVKSDHWLWIYDNINFHHHVHHERPGSTSCQDKERTSKLASYPGHLTFFNVGHKNSRYCQLE